MTSCAVTLLASREPVPSRFPAVCRGSRADRARRNQGEHLALPFLCRTAQALRDAAKKVQGSLKKLAMSSIPLNSHEYPHDSAEYATYTVLSERIPPCLPAQYAIVAAFTDPEKHASQAS